MVNHYTVKNVETSLDIEFPFYTIECDVVIAPIGNLYLTSKSLCLKKKENNEKL